MEVGNDQEFYMAIGFYGGLILVGLLVTIVIGLFGMAMWRKIKSGNIIKELYGKERKNGRGGSHGKF